MENLYFIVYSIAQIRTDFNMSFSISVLKYTANFRRFLGHFFIRLSLWREHSSIRAGKRLPLFVKMPKYSREIWWICQWKLRIRSCKI